MKLDISQNSKDQTYSIHVKLDQFKNLKEYEVLFNLINAIALDFDLDPEITIDDLKNIVAEAKKESAEEVFISIGTEGIDLEF